MKKSQLDLRNEPVGSLLWKMSLPSITAMLVMAFYNFVDVFWLSRLGPQAIAAVTIAFPIQMLFGGFGVGTGVGAGSFAARMFGAGEKEKANQTAGQIIFLSFFISAVVIAPGLIFHDAILKLFGATEEILPLSREYFTAYLFTTPFLIFMISAGNLFRAEGNPNYSMYALTTAAVLGAILDPLLIFGWGPFPELGIRGAAYAAGISQFITCALSLRLFMKPTSAYHVRKEHIAPNLPVIIAIYRVGLPSMIMNFIISIVLTFYNHILGSYGPAAVATLGIIFRVQGLIIWVLVGIGHGVMPLVGFSFGAGLYRRLIDTVNVAVKYGGILTIVSCALLQVFTDPLIHIFTADPEAVSIAVPALRIFALSLPFAGANFTWISMFNGLGKGFVSMSLLLLRDIVLLIPLLILFSMQFGLAGVWAAQPMANACLFLGALYLTKREFRRFPATNPASLPEK
ncbi:MAG TPA: MATE family efflux transporter [Syntrophales bacterium]|nr:MATE family efflux transporter [Syntrophales bacterium]